MKQLIARFLVGLAVSGLISCGDSETSEKAPAGEQTAKQQAKADSGEVSTNARGDKTEDRKPIFVPVDDGHAQNLKDRADENAAIDRRMDEAAKARYVADVESKLKEYQAHFKKQRIDKIDAQFVKYEADLNNRYLEQIDQSLASLNGANDSVLAEQLQAEKQLVEAGKTPPQPDNSGVNPGLKPLNGLRKWYHEGLANIAESRRKSEANLLNAYEDSLRSLLGSTADFGPSEAVNRVRNELESLGPDSIK